MRWRVALPLLIPLTAVAVGLACEVPSVNLDGKACDDGHPCIQGYVCDYTGACVTPAEFAAEDGGTGASDGG